MNERKAFQYLPGNENPQFLEDGLKIFHSLKVKYPDTTDEHLDNILNSLCAAIHILMINSVEKDNYKMFVQLIYKILNQNIEGQ